MYIITKYTFTGIELWNVVRCRTQNTQITFNNQRVIQNNLKIFLKEVAKMTKNLNLARPR